MCPLLARHLSQNLSMQSITKASLSPADVRRVVEAALGEEVAIVSELKEGYFNAAFRVDFASRPPAVIKFAPDPSIKLLRYEVGLMKTEVEAMNLVRPHLSVPVPQVMAYDPSRKLIGHDFFIMEFLEGQAFHLLAPSLTAPQVDKIQHQVGQMLAELHRVPGRSFGIFSGDQGLVWSDAFLEVFEGVFLDAQESGVALPVERIHAAIRLVTPDLALVKASVFVHWDIWSGNIFVDTESLQLTGLIDFERAWWADPLFDVNFMEPSTTFLEGYGHDPLDDPAARRRRKLYDVYLGSLMQVEHVLRAYPDGEPATEWGMGVLQAGLASLGV